jgi:non-ribosomal peptide synthetase component F
VNFRAQAGPRPALELPGLESAPIPIDIGFSRFDLALELQVETDGVTGFVEYDEDLFDRSTIAALVEDFGALLEQAIAAPDTPILALRLPHGRASSVKTQAPIRRPRQSDHS